LASQVLFNHKSLTKANCGPSNKLSKQERKKLSTQNVGGLEKSFF